MSNITLSASVRQNLLSLQSTSDLLAQTQNRLATGNKVNTALDNPTNYFTAQSLNNRSSDISNLLDSVGNGVQVLQAANTGITSLQSLIASAKSVANQALQATSGYSTKSQFVSSASGATASNLLGATTPGTAGTVTAGTFSTVSVAAGTSGTSGSLAAGAFTGPLNVSSAGTPGTSGSLAASAFSAPLDVSAAGSGPTGAAAVDTTGFSALDVSTGGGVQFSLNVDGTSQSIDISNAAVTTYNADVANTSNQITSSASLSVADVAKLVNYQFSGDATTGPASTNAGQLELSSTTTGTTSQVTVSGLTGTPAGGTLGLTNTSGSNTGTNAVAAASLSFSVAVDGGTAAPVSISAAALTTYNADSANSASQITDASSALSGADVAKLINYQVGSTVATFAGGNLTFASSSTGTNSNVVVSGLATAGGASNTTGIANGTGTAGTAGTAAASLSFSVAVDGGTAAPVSISAAALTTYNANSANSASQITDASSALSGADVAKLINYQVGSTVATFAGGNLTFASSSTGTNSNVVVSGLATAGGASNTTGIANGTGTAGTAGTSGGSLAFNVTLDGGTAHPVTISAAALTTYNANSANSASQITDASTALSGADVAKLINYQVGSNVATFANNKLSFTSTTTGSNSSVAVTAATAANGATDTTGLSALTNTGTAATGGLTGLELTIASTGGGTATDITFGTGAGQVSTLDQLNTALAANNLEASVDTTGKITVTTSNDIASTSVGAIGGSAVSTTGSPFASSSVAAPVNNIDAQNNRATLVSQYNTIIDQIQKTAQDSSFNGVNLLNGDQLKLVFNETGSSTLNVQGVTDDPAGLGLSSLTAGTDFLDNASTNKVLDTLNSASDTLRSQASTLGSNLSIVQIRQDFSKNLINVLQTGASNLTLADTNEEAANSQALSTRQSIAVSALALANTSQQSVLRLLQ